MSASPVSSPSSSATRSHRLAPGGAASRSWNASGSPDVRPSRLVITDDDLLLHVRSRLSQFGPQVARAVTARVRHGDVTLVGDVGSDYERLLVEHSINRLAGVGSLENRLQIRSGDAAPTQTLGRAMASANGLRKVLLAAGAACVVAAGWGIWLLAAACTG